MATRVAELSRRASRWLLPAAALVLAPKCLFCVLAYAGLGAALGIGGPLMCGEPVPHVSSLAWLGAAAGVGTLGILAIRRRPSGGQDRLPSAATVPGPGEAPAKRDGGALRG